MVERKEIEISLIIPSYNSEKYIKNTIKSCINFFRNYKTELIIVDDGSLDNTVNIVKKIAYLTSENIKVLSSSHAGPSSARNIGISNAKGKYLMFCDSDDLLIGILEKTKFDEDLVIFSSKCNSEYKCSSLNDKFGLISDLFGFDNHREKFSGCNGGSYSKLFKRNFLKKDKIKFSSNLKNSEDVLFNCEVILKSVKIRIIKKGIYLYVKHPESITHSRDEHLLYNHIVFINNLKKMLKSYHECDLLVEKIESLYLYQLIFRCLTVKNSKKEYIFFKESINKQNKWSSKLERPIEIVSIRIVNNFGIKSAVVIAKGYLFFKQKLKIRDRDVIL